MALRGGEAEKLTAADENVNSFAWSPDSKQLAFTMTDPVTDAMKEREKRYGDIKIEDQDQRYTHLYLFDIAAKTSKQLTKGNFVVGSFEWSPDGSRIAFDHRTTSDPADGNSADISVVIAEHRPVAGRRRPGGSGLQSALGAGQPPDCRQRDRSSFDDRTRCDCHPATTRSCQPQNCPWSAACWSSRRCRIDTNACSAGPDLRS